MIAVQLWFTCSVPECEARTEALVPLFEADGGRLTIGRGHLESFLPEGWRLGPWYHNVVVCPLHLDRRDDWKLKS